ncbi:MAG TPA: alpha/beta fold hydrolase [Candidatus Cryosericum sp.]|nr:alpha/beta fold hydrolase [Candidatus Cryosericum sp.]
MRLGAHAAAAGLLSLLVAPPGPGAAPPPARTASRPAAPRIENRTASVLGLKIHYLQSGRGAPVVLLHGTGGSADAWRPAMSALSRDLRVIAPDQIGFGASDKPPIDYTPGTLVDFLGMFLKQLGIDRASLVGHATGARVACLFALAHPDRVDRLVLISGTAYKPNLDQETLAALNFSTLAGARRLLELAYFDDKARVTDALASDLFSKRLRSGSSFTIGRLEESYSRGEGYVDDLSPIQAPTLILWAGGRDCADGGRPTGEAADPRIAPRHLRALRPPADGRSGGPPGARPARVPRQALTSQSRQREPARRVVDKSDSVAL